MNVTVKIYYSDKPYSPALYFCEWKAAWQLWFTLTKSMERGKSGPHVEKVEIWDGATQMKPEKGLNAPISTQYY